MMIASVVNNDKNSFTRFTNAFLNKGKKSHALNLPQDDEGVEDYFGCGICMDDLAKNPMKCSSCEVVNCRECSINWK